MYAKRVAEAVELAKARASAIMVRKGAAEGSGATHETEPATRELAAAESDGASRHGK